MEVYFISIIAILMPTSKKPRTKKYRSPKGSGGLLGGGKKTSSPVTANDTGKSNSYLSVLAGISEGEIQGLVNGANSIYFDDTPVINSDGSANFTGFSFDTRSGTQNQTYIPGFGESVNQEVAINSELKYLQPITRQIVNKNLDLITVRLSLTLQTQDDKGNVDGTDINYRISIKEGLNAYRITHDIAIVNQKYSSPTEFEYVINVNNYSGTVDTFFLKVERLSPTVAEGVNTLKNVNFVAFINSSVTKLTYPNTALVGLKFEASQFSSAPKVAFEILGVIVDIPSNAFVGSYGSIGYTGVWDGTFITPNYACSDPAWILWDLLTKKRYGLGNKLNITNLNRWKFLEISKYCNGAVPDGNGGYENRFLTNFVLETAEDAYKVIETIRSVFHGMSYFLNGAINFEADFPGPYVAQFTQSDVESGMFSYSRTGLKAVHNVAIVTWIDPIQGYTKQIETVEDYESIITNGYNATELVAFGATTRGQARRAGLYVLYSEKLDRETVTFKCRSYAANVLPGQLIKVADNKRANIRYGGLIKSSTVVGANITIGLDYVVSIIPGEVYSLSVMAIDGKLYEFGTTNIPGSYTSITIPTNTLVSPIAIEGNWILSSVNIKPQLFRVLNRVCVSGSNETMFEITALQHNPSKYNAIEFNYPLDPITTRTTASTVTNPVTDIKTVFNALGVYPALTYTLFSSWNKPRVNGLVDPFVTSYLVEYKNGLFGKWTGTTTVTDSKIEFIGLQSGNNYIRVASIDIYGRPSKWVESAPRYLGINSSRAASNDPRNTEFATLVF